MDDKDKQLYAEETRQLLIETKAAVAGLAELVQKQIDAYKEPPTELTVKGAVEVNTEKELKVTNLKEMKEWLSEYSNTIKAAIESIPPAPDPLTEVNIKNIKEAVAKELKITNLKELKVYFEKLAKAFADSQPVINLEQNEIVWPKSPKEAIPVRLSDGKSFYNAIMAAMSSALPEVDPLVGYQICERDDEGATKYYGYAKASGAWYIMRESSTGSYRFHQRGKLASTLGDVWSTRASLEYGYIYEVF